MSSEFPARSSQPSIANPPPLADESRPDADTRSLALPDWKMSLIGVLAAVIVFFVGAGLDWFVLHENESRNIAISVSDTLAAVIAGALIYRLLQYERDRRRQLRQRLEVIAEMNHHVRNALQVISFTTHSYADQQQLTAVKQSVERIQWALKEILPKL